MSALSPVSSAFSSKLIKLKEKKQASGNKGGRPDFARGDESRLARSFPWPKLRKVKRSRLALDQRPLYISCYERFVRYASTTNIHGFLFLARLHEMNWFFRFFFTCVLFSGIGVATYFITLEADNFQNDIVDIINDYEQ